MLIINAEIPKLSEGSRVKWGIDKILRATGVCGQVQFRWDRTCRAEMVEFPGVPDHTVHVRRSDAYMPCRYYSSAISGKSHSIELCLIQDSDKAKPVRRWG